MATERSLKATAVWAGHQPDDGMLETNSLEIPHLATLYRQSPQSTTPEELLLAAASSCYLITLRTILENRGIQVNQIEILSEAFVEDNDGLRFDTIVHRPTIVLCASDEGKYSQAQLKKLAAHAEHTCMVSSALRGNVDVTVHPTIQIETTTL